MAKSYPKHFSKLLDGISIVLKSIRFVMNDTFLSIVK
jgi:hypothetical protein